MGMFLIPLQISMPEAFNVIQAKPLHMLVTKHAWNQTTHGNGRGKAKQKTKDW